MAQEGSEVTQQFKSFTIADPRDFDGNPFEVAERGVSQLQALMLLAEQSLPAAELMARNAEMTRRMDLGGEPEGDKWVETPQGRQWAALKEDLKAVQKRLKVMKAAASYDPRHPPK
jgi:hypothetical protein